MSWQTTLSAGRLIAKERVPYFSSMLFGLVPMVTTAIETMAVTNKAVLLINPAFVSQVTPGQMAGLLVHEIMHVTCGHVTVQRQFGRDKRYLALAQDLAINPAVVDMGLELPKGDLAGVFPESPSFPKEQGFKRGLSQDEYYELLIKRAEQKGGEGDLPKRPMPGQGWCGSCGAREAPNEPKDGPNQKEGEGGRTEQEMQRLLRATAEAVADHARSQVGRGSMPDMLKRWAEEMIKPPTIPWHTKLRRIEMCALNWAAGAVDTRYDWPSRRQAGIGFGAGRPILPRYRAPTPMVDIVGDTSGSMSKKEIGNVVSETMGVIKQCNATVRFAACDADCKSVRKVKTAEELADALVGGGGTDMRPAFAALMQQRPKPKVIICITDGLVGSGFPTAPPPGVRVIIVLVGPYAQKIPNTEWAETIVVPPDAPIERLA